MLQPREGTGRAGRGPGRGGKPRELPIRSRDAVAASPHRTAAAAAGMGNPRPPLSAGTPRAPPAANARGCGAESAESPESRGASRIPGGSRIRGGGGVSHPADGGTEGALPHGQPPAQPRAPGSPRSPQPPRVPGIPHQPRTGTGKQRCHPHTPGDGSPGERAAPSRRTRTAAAPGESRRETSAGANLPCAAVECGAVRDRCGTGAGAAAAPAPPGSRAAAPRSPAHYSQAPPPPSKPRPSAARPAPSHRPAHSGVLSAGTPQRSPGVALGAAFPPGAPPVPGAARSPPCSPGGTRGAERLGSPWERPL